MIPGSAFPLFSLSFDGLLLDRRIWNSGALTPLCFSHLQELDQKEEENRRLRKSVSRREEEARQWRDRLEEVEGALREALGDVTGTKTGLLDVRYPDTT